VSKLKARLASNADDKEMQIRLSEANRSIANALQICQRVANKSELGSQSKHRARHYANLLRQAQSLLGGVGYLIPNIDMTDPDLQPEKEKRFVPEVQQQPATPPSTWDEIDNEVL
jgi:hypothetical protein